MIGERDFLTDAGENGEGWIEDPQEMLDSIMDIRRVVASVLAKDYDLKFQLEPESPEVTATPAWVKDQLSLMMGYSNFNVKPPLKEVIQSPWYKNQLLGGIARTRETNTRFGLWQDIADSGKERLTLEVLPKIIWWWETINVKLIADNTPIAGLMLGWVGFAINHNHHHRYLYGTGNTYIRLDEAIRQALKPMGKRKRKAPPWVPVGLQAIKASSTNEDWAKIITNGLHHWVKFNQ